MRLFGFIIGAMQGAFVVGLLAIAQAIVQAFRPAWELPFSIWWGLLFCIPSFAWGIYVGRFLKP